MKRWKGWGLWFLLALAVLPLCRNAAFAQGAATEPLISPDEMLAVGDVRPGMKGYGLSVFEGTRIERFNVTVLGVLRKIDFGGDLVLIKIEDGAPVTSGSGVSAGMSGSPIYVGGKLVGALAFAWPFAKQPVAGVTPISQMLENYRPGSAPPPPSLARAGDLQPEGGPLKLDGQLFARATVVPDRGLVPASAGSTLYLAPVATPVMVSGMGRPGLDTLRQRFSRFSAVVAPAPGKVDLPAAERPRLEPGSAIGVQMLGGDVDATAIGTVTYVKGDHVLAFGHPMFGLGAINMPMTTAYIHGIIPSQEVSFKMGAPVETVGSISQDRNWSIGGQQGQMAPTVSAEFSITDSDRGVKRDYRVTAAVQKDLTSSLLYGAMVNAIGSVSPPSTGTTRGTVEVWAKGMPPIKRDNVFSLGERKSQLEQLFGDPLAGMPMVELLQIMDTLENNPFGTVPLEKIRVTVDVSQKRRTATIERAYADRKRVKPGDKVKIGVVLQPANAPKEVREYEVEIPQNIPGGRLLLGVSGGGAAERVRQYMQITRPTAKTLVQLVSQISDREQNSDLSIEMAQTVAGVSVSGREFPNLPNVVVEVLTGANPSGIRMVRSHTRQVYDTPWVLSGGHLLVLQVDSDEKDKSGADLAFGVAAPGGLNSILDLFRLTQGGDISGEIGDTGEGGLSDGEEAPGVAKRPGLPGTRLYGTRLPLGTGPDEPAMPSFAELQQLLTGEADAAGGTEGSTATAAKKGVARGPGVWRIASANDFQGGKLENVLVSSRGELGLAPQSTSLLASPDRFFWAQATDRAGNVYVGGWLEGSILKIAPDGKSTPFFDAADEVAISALTMDGDGYLYASAEPSGSIYRIGPDGKGTVFCKLPDERVWVLKKMGDAVYAGTGSQGRLYRIGANGKPELVFSAPDRHVFALAEDGKGGFYCGTYPRGKVFHLEQGKVRPVYELPDLTVTALATDAKGNLYIGTSPRATVLKLSPGGDVSTVFTSKERHIFSLLVDEGGSVYAATGRQARVYRIAPDKTVQTVWDSPASYVLSLTRDAQGNLFATTAGPTQVVRLGAQAADSGTYTSKVLNAGNLAKWGMVRWNGAAAGVQLQTRTGSTAYPDATWSDWSAPYSRPEGQGISSPGGQFLQYRVLLKQTAGSPAPNVRNLELFFRPRNRAPQVAVAKPAASEILSGTRVIQWTAKDPDNDRLSFDVYYAQEGTDMWIKIGSRAAKGSDEAEDTTAGLAPAARLPKVAARPAVRPAPARVVTRASVPASRRVATAPRWKRVLSPSGEATELPGMTHGTPITVTVAAAEETATEEEAGSETALNWNTRKLPDGRYRIRVVASDAATSPDDAATSEAISEAVLLDNTAPKILIQAVRRVGLTPPAGIQVKEVGTYVSSAEYRVDSGEWIGAAAADGIFDSPEETVRIDAARLKPGRHALQIRVRDAAGNESLAKMGYVLPVKK